ncbi:hypothetical protein BTO10_01070 [Vibrio chagasii]|uniref:Uncharacterized protein n=1 Tax=Vibrio chagasii TaxID=170679 RepID=A0A2S7VPP4_9VIBR|nr:hypothetical protein [Vibrio chagasii]PQJ63441.1 hypothetical protein BTO10_01070 [Vibrio chagasii]
MFFENDNNLKILGGFLNRTQHYSSPIEEVFHKRLERSREVIGSISRNAKGWDERCEFNIEHIGNNFLDRLREFSTADTDFEVIKSFINDIYTDSFRFLCEFDFYIGENLQLSFDLRQLKSSIIDDALETNSSVKSQIIYAAYTMPADILKSHLNNKDLVSATRFQDKLDEAKILKEQWDRELAEKQETVDILDKRLEKIKISFNFVGLYQGFSDLGDKKENELEWLFRSLIGMSFLILFPLVYEFVSISTSSSSTNFQFVDLIKLIPLVSIELILIYFFRIILMNYRSTKAQIMQIELRQTLCQFIQSYSEYASELKSKDPNSLDKFESLIFSGILSDSEKLPSTFDGIDQIGALLKNLKGS